MLAQSSVAKLSFAFARGTNQQINTDCRILRQSVQDIFNIILSLSSNGGAKGDNIDFVLFLVCVHVHVKLVYIVVNLYNLPKS